MKNVPAWLNKSNRKKADRRDRAKAKASGGEYVVVSNSGAGKKKMDLVGEFDAVETKFTTKKSFILKAKDLTKAFSQVNLTAQRGKIRWPVFEITMRDENDKDFKVVVLKSSTYEMLLDIYRKS